MQNLLCRENGLVTIAIMAKYWDVGKVKTRLGRSIGMSAAAHLHRTFTLFLCQTLNDAADRRLLAMTPPSRQSNVAEALMTLIPTHDWQWIDQGSGDLGSRLSRLFQSQFADFVDSSRLIVIGADCPLVDHSIIREASERLDEHDVVLGPAVDGGYYLIGLASPWRESYAHLFSEMPWGSSFVLEATQKRILSAGLSSHLLVEQEDIDTIDELNRLRSHLKVARHVDDQLGELADSIDRAFDR